jgi:hypothetical protein
VIAAHEVVEVPGAVGLQVVVERVIAGHRDAEVAEALVEIGFAVGVEIVKAGDLVATRT